MKSFVSKKRSRSFIAKKIAGSFVSKAKQIVAAAAVRSLLG